MGFDPSNSLLDPRSKSPGLDCPDPVGVVVDKMPDDATVRAEMEALSKLPGVARLPDYANLHLTPLGDTPSLEGTSSPSLKHGHDPDLLVFPTGEKPPSFPKNSP